MKKIKAFAALTICTLSSLAISDAGLGSIGVAPAQAADFVFSYKGNNGYSATGSFSYSGTPANISEMGSGSTSFLNSLSVSFFNPSQQLIESGSPVINGVSSDPFLLFNFDTQSQKINALDVNKGVDTGNYLFLANNFDPNVGFVPPGSIPYELSSNNNGTYSLLDSSSSVQVAAVPEPSSVFATLAFGILGAGWKLKRQLQKRELSNKGLV